jgi:hypothetical protein
MAFWRKKTLIKTQEFISAKPAKPTKEDITAKIVSLAMVSGSYFVDEGEVPCNPDKVAFYFITVPSCEETGKERILTDGDHFWWCKKFHEFGHDKKFYMIVDGGEMPEFIVKSCRDAIAKLNREF